MIERGEHILVIFEQRPELACFLGRHQLGANALVREARWAILTHMGRVEVEPIPQEADTCPVRHRSGARKS